MSSPSKYVVVLHHETLGDRGLSWSSSKEYSATEIVETCAAHWGLEPQKWGLIADPYYCTILHKTNLVDHYVQLSIKVQPSKYYFA